MLHGVNHGGDAVTQQAKADLQVAYDEAAGQGPPAPILADLGGQTLAPGVYGSASTLALTGTLTLDAGGDPAAVFVFQAGSTLITASSSSFRLRAGPNFVVLTSLALVMTLVGVATILLITKSAARPCPRCRSWPPF